ncbi:MAG: hypothetical protein KAT65_03185 [Methanophagales archaeon]|nr:hypothetical protein [Methanophagales archaeon]
MGDMGRKKKLLFLLLLVLTLMAGLLLTAAPAMAVGGDCITGYKLDNRTGFGIGGWTINVYKNGDFVKSNVTDNNTGYWQVCGLVPRNYTVCEVPKEGWTAVEPESGCYENVWLDGEDVWLGGQKVTNINFTNRENESCISGFKLHNKTEAGLANWTINVKNSTGAIVGSNVTNATGYWLVCGLPDGNYTICEENKPGWIQVSPDDCYDNVTVAGENLTGYNFTNTPRLACISGYKLSDYQLTCVGLTPGYWKNWDNHYNDSEFEQLLNGTIADGNISVADEIFANYNASPDQELTILKAHLLATQLTLHLTASGLHNPDDAYLTGECTIELEGNEFNVGEVVNNALNITANPGNYTRDEILEVKDQLDMINNLEGDGLIEGKVGLGLPGWTINVTNSAGVEWTTTTNDTGYWQVCGLAPGNYTVCEVPQTGWTAVEPESGCRNVTLDGVNQPNINFTNVKTELTCISGYKRNESNVGLKGWTIKVTNGTGGEWTAITNETGYWQICGLEPGDYVVTEVLKDGWKQLEPAEGNYSFTLAGDDKTGLNFTNTQEGIPGTGTPGYWKNHPGAWPVDNITIGGVNYTKDDAIANMSTPDKKDKTYTMFRALVAAKLNVLIGNDDSCIKDTIAAADEWMTEYPVGSGVKAGGKNSPWREGEPLYLELDKYNNGLLCAPSRG